MSQIQDLIDEARSWITDLKESLPEVVDPATISLRAKIPYKTECYRAGLSWRMEELSRAACDCYERSDQVAGILLSRGAVETSAACWYLHDLMKKQVERGVQANLDEKVMSLLLGHRNVDNMPTAINVLNFLDVVSKELPKARQMYDEMSEYAHPNWTGTEFAFSKIDYEKHLSRYGRGLTDKPDRHAGKGLRCLNAALMMFELSSRRITGLLRDFVKACEAELSV